MKSICNLYLTFADTLSLVTRLVRDWLTGENLNKIRILKKETILEMTKNQIGDISLKNAGAYFNPEWCCNFNGLISSTSKWGLAWLIDAEEKPYGRKAGTVLWGGMMNTYFYVDYKSGIAASIYAQHVPFNHPETSKLFDRFFEIIYTGR